MTENVKQLLKDKLCLTYDKNKSNELSRYIDSLSYEHASTLYLSLDSRIQEVVDRINRIMKPDQGFSITPNK